MSDMSGKSLFMESIHLIYEYTADNNIGGRTNSTS